MISASHLAVKPKAEPVIPYDRRLRSQSDVVHRGPDPNKVAARNIARALPMDAWCPAWARFGRSFWSAGVWRLIVPLYSKHGTMGSLHARAIDPDSRPKGLHPHRDAGLGWAGLVMADRLGKLLLEGGAVPDAASNTGPAADMVRRFGVWIVEGVPDFLTLATYWPEEREQNCGTNLITGDRPCMSGGDSCPLSGKRIQVSGVG
jgi:hypothetical protein